MRTHAQNLSSHTRTLSPEDWTLSVRPLPFTCSLHMRTHSQNLSSHTRTLPPKDGTLSVRPLFFTYSPHMRTHTPKRKRSRARSGKVYFYSIHSLAIKAASVLYFVMVKYGLLSQKQILGKVHFFKKIFRSVRQRMLFFYVLIRPSAPLFLCNLLCFHKKRRYFHDLCLRPRLLARPKPRQAAVRFPFLRHPTETYLL